MPRNNKDQVKAFKEKDIVNGQPLKLEKSGSGEDLKEGWEAADQKRVILDATGEAAAARSHIDEDFHLVKNNIFIKKGNNSPFGRKTKQKKKHENNILLQPTETKKEEGKKAGEKERRIGFVLISSNSEEQVPGILEVVKEKQRQQ